MILWLQTIGTISQLVVLLIFLHDISAFSNPHDHYHMGRYNILSLCIQKIYILYIYIHGGLLNLGYPEIIALTKEFPLQNNHFDPFWESTSYGNPEIYAVYIKIYIYIYIYIFYIYTPAGKSTSLWRVAICS